MMIKGMPMQMEADENEGDNDLYLQNSYEGSDKDQLKKDSHEDKSVWDRLRFPRNRNMISIEGEGEVEQENLQNGTVCRRYKRSTKDIKPLYFREM